MTLAALTALRAAFSFYSNDLVASSLMVLRSMVFTATGCLVKFWMPVWTIWYPCRLFQWPLYLEVRLAGLYSFLSISTLENRSFSSALIQTINIGKKNFLWLSSSTPELSISKHTCILKALQVIFWNSIISAGVGKEAVRKLKISSLLTFFLGCIGI